ncbi:DUF4439 domain-containing protein [Arthrobacter sp. CJ23]|uniref:DUF4439 domain-containing protein n=1 Tax=Arthrobacter sp. CJ23 TaxID=2972479 RepID=UPI00215C954C|nr:DUF4439 domain-containing protein [Arthrobacter sp. CJ23]UVJ40899.1 DUF4439 domain-containing protein [Arthrobacter sp. CJ23]
MTTWSVVKDESKENGRMPRWARTALASLLSVIVLATGMVLIPRDPGPPPAVPFSESARAGALADTFSLLDAATGLRTAAAVPGRSALPDTVLADTVTLLTTQSRALLSPAQATPPAGSAAPDRSEADPSETAPTPQAVVAALSASGAQRLADAADADGGIARLLAAVGTAQILQSARLAAAAGLPAPAAPAQITPTAVPTATGACPPSAAPTAPGTATLAGALAAAIRAEHEAVYVHQVALTRLAPAASGAAQNALTALTAHQAALHRAEALGHEHCLEVPPREAGYRLPEQLSTKPLAALGMLEAGMLPGFGDLIALGTGDTRQWALDGLLEAARRSTAWGTPLEALPGLVVDAAALPPLPAPATSAPAANAAATSGP